MSAQSTPRRGFLAASAAALPVGAVAAVESNPDAELLRLLREAEAAMHAYQDSPIFQANPFKTIPEMERVKAVYLEASKIPARTVAGLQAKAQMARWSAACGFEDSPPPWSDGRDFLEWSLLDDILALPVNSPLHLFGEG